MTRDTHARGQSEATGVLLMAAVVLVLAGVVAGAAFFVYGDQLQEIPQASFSYDYDEANESLVVKHESGSDVPGDRIRFRRAAGPKPLTVADWSSEAEVTSGESIVVGNVTADTVVEIVYVSNRERGKTAALDRWEGPAV